MFVYLLPIYTEWSIFGRRNQLGFTNVGHKSHINNYYIILTFMWVLSDGDGHVVDRGRRRRRPASSQRSAAIASYETMTWRRVGRSAPLRLPVNGFLAHLSERNTEKTKWWTIIKTETRGTAVHVSARTCIYFILV